MKTETAGPASTVTELHSRWQQRMDRLDTVPGCPTPQREARLVECEQLETEVGQTPARHAGEIILKLRMVLTGRTAAAMSDAALLSGAIEDLQRMDSRDG